EFLKLYSKVFDLVEIDSTFYTIPPPATIRSWRDSVPDSFSFAAKLPRVITHENAMRPTREALDRFYRSIGELRPKVATLLVQLPPFLHQDDGMERVLAFVLFNHHFAGFGPACADQFRRILGLPGVDFAAIHTPEHGQKRLLEFGGPES